MAEKQACIKDNKLVKKSTNKLFNEAIKQFLSSNVEISSAKEVTEFLNYLHSIDYISLYDKTFTLEYKNLKNRRNMSYLEWDIEENTQKIVIANNWKNSAPLLLKKSMIIDTYLHEVTHEKQCDFASISDSLRLNAYEKMLSIEYLEFANIPYELRIREMDARIKGMHAYVNLLKQGVIPVTQETLYCPLYNIDDIIFIFNRFKVSKDEINLDIDKYVKRYFASMILELRIDEKDSEHKFLFKESFRLKFRVILTKILKDFIEDVEYIYSLLMQTYKMSNKIKTYLNISKEQEKEMYANAKNYKCNDYYLNLMNLDLYDRYYHQEKSFNPLIRKDYINKQKEKEK